MHRLSSLARLALAIAAATLLTLTSSGCLVESADDGAITCSRLDDFLYYCDPACAASFYCEDRYYSLPLSEQLLLDDCADCLHANLQARVCADCFVWDGPYEFSCADVLSADLGVRCAWWR